MRVGLLIDRWDPLRGGAEAALQGLAEHLLGAGHEVRVVAREVRGEAPAPVHLARGVTRGVTRGAREVRLAHALTDAARRADCTVALGVRHLEHVDALWLHGGCHRASLAARARGRGEVEPRGRHRVFDALERAALAGGARAVVCPSELVREELLARYPGAASRLHVVPAGVDLERFHPREHHAARSALRAAAGLPDDDVPLLAFVARNPALKGLTELLAALPRVEGAWRLLVAGPRRPRPWLARVRRTGIDPARVRFLPRVDPVSAAAGADLCVLPTWRDTAGLVLLEALACGTPVVTTRFAGVARGLPAQAGEVLDDPADSEGLAWALTAQLERVHAGIDRDAVRAGVSERSLGGQNRAIEHLLASLAPG